VEIGRGLTMVHGACLCVERLGMLLGGFGALGLRIVRIGCSLYESRNWMGFPRMYVPGACLENGS
jgi:hypothetical protein